MWLTQGLYGTAAVRRPHCCAAACQGTRVYAAQFSAAELRDIIAFYRTPSGQRFVQSQTALAQQAMTAGQQFAQKLVVDMQERMKQELRKKGHSL